jgi:hypothetical protein
MHLDWVERLVVSKEQDAHHLVLEPRGGGDAHIQHKGQRIIEQYKVREGGTWSIREIVHGPFVDFVRAARTRKSDRDRFRFVTDGRVNHQESLLSFLERFAECTKNGMALDQQEIYAYRIIGEFTDHALLDWIHKEIQGELPKGDLLNAATLGHVLSRVKLIGGVEASLTEVRLDALLRGCVADPTKAGAVRDQLIGRLLTQLANGNVDIDPKEFLRSNGIDVDRAARLADRCRDLATVLRKVVVRGSSRYRPENDVRLPPPWDLDASPILAIAGPPGVGKTWQLISLALDLVDRDLPCVFQSVQSDALRSLDLAAETYWNDVLKTPTTIGASALKHAIKEATRKARGSPDTGPWLVALLDGPLSPGDLPALINKVAQDDEIRIAVTVPHDVAERLRDDHGSTVQVVEVSEFTPSELMAYFDTFGVEWNKLPVEMFALLRLPLLAGLFVRSGHTSYSESPDSEYGLFELLWKNLGATTGASVLRELARYAFAHPTQKDFALEHALPKHDRATLDELKKAGWIEMDHEARVQFAHDRLLNWALADAIVTDASSGQRDVDNDLPTKLRLASAQNTRFGYLLMDVFWKLTSTPHAMSLAIKLLSQIETETYDVHSTDFYQHLLPTLGAHALDLLAERKAATGQAPPNIHLVISAVRVIGKQFAGRAPVPAVSRHAREWIGKSRDTWTDVGLALAEEARLVDLIDDIKLVHFADIQAMGSDFATYQNYEASFAALKGCVGKASDWLRDQIGSTRDPEEFNALAFQLLNLENPSAPSIWKTCRHALANGTDSARGVLSCIGRFRDDGLVDYVTNALASSNPHSVGLAFCVLAAIAPDRALAHLDRMEKSDLYGWRNQWVTELYSARPAELEQWLERTLDEGHSQHELFAVISNNASPQLIQAVVDRFSRQVVQRQNSNNPWLGNWAKILTAPSVRAQTQRLAGSDTETSLVTIAKHRIDPKRGWYDHLLEDARAILLAIGGSGIQELLAFELNIARGKSVHRALEWAPLVAWPGIESVLASHVATKDANGDSDDQLISNHDAIVGLTALDAHQELERAVFTSAIHGFPLNALTLREGQPSFPPATVERIQSALAQAPSLNDEELVQQLILAALAQMPELAPTIERTLLQRDPTTQTVFVHGAHAALQYPVSESLALWAQQWLPNKDTRRLAIALHLKCGSEASYRHLLGYAREIAATDRDLAAEIVARLPSSGESALGADALAIEIFNVAAYAVDCYRRVARCGGPVERGTLRQRAYQADPSFLDLRRSAIAALATIDALEAARAALWLAEQVPEQELFAADVVIRFGSDDHILQLIGLCNRLGRHSLWDHVGRSFRQRAPESRDRLLRELGSRDEISFRRAFAELTGWLGEEQRAALLARVAVENSRTVHKALRNALRRIDELAALKATLTALQGAQDMQAAALLHAALAANEPFLLSDPDDELYVGKALDRLPKYFGFFAMKQLVDLCRNFKSSDS